MSTRLEGFWKDDPKNYTNLFCFLFTRSFQFVQSCNVGPTPAHNLLQTQQNHNLALIIMFTTTKYCKIISSFMLFCKILSGAPFPCVVKMLKCFYYLKSSSSFLTFFNFHIICTLEHIIICLVSCHMLVPIFAWWKKIQFFSSGEVISELILKVTVIEILGLHMMLCRDKYN